jgi:hypothetical protein
VVKKTAPYEVKKLLIISTQKRAGSYPKTLRLIWQKIAGCFFNNY